MRPKAPQVLFRFGGSCMRESVRRPRGAMSGISAAPFRAARTCLYWVGRRSRRASDHRRARSSFTEYHGDSDRR
ncbi:Uncharacterised protein [Burkholderia pseudomallei]|uniref:Uncharacterized protein n=1 Tax=Burkholderia pseudomallei 1710a TaxID=320371 RepID=A0A0E1WJT6_BURPE|nr:hypothetical protein BURPS668_0160 [Burkholderia pseudomallei 668]EEH29298.1 conserved hypothetical protein [Burkholderia pseudomallei Pakistan 9]EET09887.1 hypothetical protein BURPS1710A_0426 [Burkholderia pseudomallei 1710a]KGC31600.1 hypothetical protein DO73_2015 [Burkholderia pseudomallei]KGS10486.1 hypothetical protein X977_159 [Burkholderia pseudomallei MSHR7504]KGS20054.1 hypothetical protein X962_5699 [Burkholderia pseudomallei MSHR7343]KGS21136.1 hypothetical protein X941_5653 [